MEHFNWNINRLVIYSRLTVPRIQFNYQSYLDSILGHAIQRNFKHYRWLCVCGAERAQMHSKCLANDLSYRGKSPLTGTFKEETFLVKSFNSNINLFKFRIIIVFTLNTPSPPNTTIPQPPTTSRHTISWLTSAVNFIAAAADRRNIVRRDGNILQSNRSRQRVNRPRSERKATFSRRLVSSRLVLVQWQCQWIVQLI